MNRSGAYSNDKTVRSFAIPKELFIKDGTVFCKGLFKGSIESWLIWVGFVYNFAVGTSKRNWLFVVEEEIVFLFPLWIRSVHENGDAALRSNFCPFILVLTVLLRIRGFGS